MEGSTLLVPVLGASLDAVETVASIETRVNAMEVEIDQELSSIIEDFAGYAEAQLFAFGK